MVADHNLADADQALRRRPDRRARCRSTSQAVRDSRRRNRMRSVLLAQRVSVASNRRGRARRRRCLATRQQSNACRCDARQRNCRHARAKPCFPATAGHVHMAVDESRNRGRPAASTTVRPCAAAPADRAFVADPQDSAAADEQMADAERARRVEVCVANQEERHGRVAYELTPCGSGFSLTRRRLLSCADEASRSTRMCRAASASPHTCRRCRAPEI